MEPSLSITMRNFQDQMVKEICNVGDSTKEEWHLKEPELVTFWELDKFFPSSENDLLRICLIQVFPLSITLHSLKSNLHVCQALYLLSLLHLLSSHT